jgi:DNA-binding GntR family transcriptional regulator
MGISQGPIREAIQRLSTEGLVITFPHKGTYISQISQEEIQEVYSLRELLESFAVKRAMAKISHRDIVHLQGLVDEMRDCARLGDHPGLVERDMRFHEYVCEKSGHKILLDVWRMIDGRVRGFLSITNRMYWPDLSEIASCHQALVDSLKSGDPEGASEEFCRHMRGIWDRILGVFGQGEEGHRQVPDYPTSFSERHQG